MLTQGESETRKDFLFKVATAFLIAHQDDTDSMLIDYDGTTCDGACLLMEMKAELEEEGEA